MDNINKIYIIHKELSKTEKVITGTQLTLDKIAEDPTATNSQERYKILNDILNACLKARGDLQEQLQTIHIESIRSTYN